MRGRRTLCVAVHDVAPATWSACRRLLDMLDTLGAGPLTLLVVPDYHRRGRIGADAEFVRAIDARIARGDEVALHGYFHLDDAAPGRSLLQWARRRWLTAGEGEFAALSADDAAKRLADGLALFGSLGWRPSGFVAPAWLLGNEARDTLTQTPLAYTSSHTHLIVLDGKRRVAAPAISASVRSAWRRSASLRWLPLAARLTTRAPIVRVALHPADAEHPEVMRAWFHVIESLLRDRVASTKAGVLALE